MIHRLAIAVGSIAAAAILALGFAATGFGPAAAPVDAEQPTLAAAAVTTTDLVAARPITRVETTTVYVKPAPKPKVIHVTKRAPAASRKQTPTRKHTKVVQVNKSSGGEREDDEREGGHEREDD